MLRRQSWQRWRYLIAVALFFAGPTASLLAGTSFQPPTYGPTISGYAYVDFNQNGRRDSADWYVGGAIIELIPSYDPSHPIVTKSKADGSFTLQVVTSPLSAQYTGTLYMLNTAYTLVELIPHDASATGSTIGNFLDLKGKTIKSGTKSGQVHNSASSNWYGTTAPLTDIVQNIYLPNPTTAPGWDNYYNKKKNQYYSLVNYNFGNYFEGVSPPPSKHGIIWPRQTVWATYPSTTNSYATLSFTTTGGTPITTVSGLRMIDNNDAPSGWYSGSSYTPGAVSISGTYGTTGTKQPSAFLISQSGGLLCSADNGNVTVPSTGTVGVVKVGSGSTSVLNFGWANLGPLSVGPQSATMTLTDTGAPGNPKTTLSVSGAVLANRYLTVSNLGVVGNPVRIMAGSALTTTVSTPVGAPDDNHATRVNTVSAGTASDSSNGITASWVLGTGGLPQVAQFNGPSQSAQVTVRFSGTALGSHLNSLDLAANLLANGEAASVGAAVQPAYLDYNVNVLEQRRLAIPGSGTVSYNALLGATAIAGQLEVDSTNSNPDSAHTTSVYVAKTGQNISNGSGDSFAVGPYATPISSGSPALLPFSATLASATTYGNLSASGSLPVLTAEATSVQDKVAYPNLPVGFNVNVGNASLGTSSGSFTGAMVLSARVANSAKMTNLASRVNQAGTLAQNPTLLEDVLTTGLTGWDGVVGSEAVIATSTTLNATSDVTMQWRSRTGVEAASAGVPTPAESPTLPDDWSGLVSDVVKISGVGSSTVYALQMSFDERLNLVYNGMGGALDTLFNSGSLFMVEVNPSTNGWEKASNWLPLGAHAQLQQFEPLSDFLIANSGYNLSDLLGSWGVDPTPGPTGLAHAWAIVKGDGTFAVVPEPSTAALLAIAGIFGLGLAKRRWRRKRPVS
jgi:hypothetical protein